MIKMVCKVFIFLLILVGLGLRIEGYAQKADIVKAKVISERIDSSFEDKDFVNQSMEVRILEGINIGQVVTVNSSVNRSKAIDLYEKGDNIYLIKGMEGEYFFADRDRLPQIGIIFGIFFIIVVALAGKRGFGSIVGLASSVLIIAFYIIPQIVNGQDPFIVSLQGIFVAALVSFYFAHGFNRRTTIALVGTIITLVLAGVIAWYFTRLLSLTGSYSEDTAYLQRGVLENLDLRGLFLGGVMLGTLGVLDDITTAQVAAVEQLKKANFELDMRQLFVRSYEIGKEHIAGLVNTLAFAYIGSSFAFLLSFTVNNTNPWWFILNSEFIATEIVQTLVGSTALVLAVPITTLLASRFYSSISKESLNKSSLGDVHNHVH